MTNGKIKIEGDIECPNCGYVGQDYNQPKNLTGQRVLECPECGRECNTAMMIRVPGTGSLLDFGIEERREVEEDNGSMD